MLVNGKGTAVVINTGDRTFMGRTAKLAVSTGNEDTPIAKEIKDFVIKVSAIAFFLGISFFIIGMVSNGEIIRNVIFLIGIIVANVPEGLLATVTVSLTLTANRMFHKNVQVKNLESVETLGSTSVICSDKTGTLTTNKMTCQHVYFDEKEVKCDTDTPANAVTGDFYDKNKKRYPDFLRLVRIAALCNNADYIDGEVDKSANATEIAMVTFAQGHIASEYTLNVPTYRNKHKKVFEITFNSTNKWQTSIHCLTSEMAIGGEMDEKEDVDSGKKKTKGIVVMKGAPERVLARCDKYFHKGELKNLNKTMRDKIMAGVLALGKQGERVLALAQKILPSEYNVDTEEPDENEKYKPEKRDTDKNGVYISYQDVVDFIELPGVDGEGNKVEFKDLKIRDVMDTYAEFTKKSDKHQFFPAFFSKIILW